MKQSFPDRLHHKTPSWVKDSSVFHIRIRCSHKNSVDLTQPEIAKALIDSVAFYQTSGKWFVNLFLVMPDHIHALLNFPKDAVMSKVIGDWKRYQHNQHGILWQENFFDHRIRSDAEYLEKAAYIRRNPVAKGLCSMPEEWAWSISNSTRK